MTSRRTTRRTDALSRERIVASAIDILDHDGEDALTFRTLASRLATGYGAIYWHVANKDELLAAAADDVIAGVVATADGGADAHAAIRSVGLGVFDAIVAHPWVGSQISRAPAGSAVLRIFEAIGRPIQSLGVPPRMHFDCASALFNYILGVAGQNAANARELPRGTNRTEFLRSVAERWQRQDPAEYPFVHDVAAQLAEHDDRDQFVAGIDLILAGIDSVSPSSDRPARRRRADRRASATRSPDPRP